jgi:hypothetical protein
MNRVPTSNLLLTDFTSGKWFNLLGFPLGEAFYQRLAAFKALGVVDFELVGTEAAGSLISAAEQAHAVRNWTALGLLSDLLIRLDGLPRLRGIGFYYRGLTASRAGKGDIAESSVAIHRAIEDCPPAYRARAISSLAANAARLGDSVSQLKLHTEAIRAASSRDCWDPRTAVGASRTVAVWKAQDGSHRAALSDLEKLFPLARTVGRWHPHVYYNYLNSLAVELANNGRVKEARNASRIVLASAFSPAYPEWRETYEEISLRPPGGSRSIVAWSQPPSCGAGGPFKVLRLRISGSADRPEANPARDHPAPVISLSDWREPARRPESGPAPVKFRIEQFERMSPAEKKEAFVELLLAGDTLDESKMDAAFAALTPNDRLMLLVDLILGPRGTEERIVAVVRCLLA